MIRIRERVDGQPGHESIAPTIGDPAIVGRVRVFDEKGKPVGTYLVDGLGVPFADNLPNIKEVSARRRFLKLLG